MKRCFIDSNIVVYANDGNAAEKQEKAIDIIRYCMTSRIGVLSIQVLQEYANIALKKLGQDPAVVIRQLRLLEAFHVVQPSPAMVRRSVEIRSSYRLAFRDANIVAAAEAGGCDIILSEDFNTGQYYAGLTVIDFFQPGIDISKTLA